MSSTQALSLRRCPWNGSSPVVSVSSTISRTSAPLVPRRNESPPLRHCSNGGKDRTHLRTRRLEPLRGVHDKIRTPAVFGVRHLLGQDCSQLFHGHAGALQHARALTLSRPRHHHHRVAPRVAAGLEQERNIQHRNLLSPRLRLSQK